MVADFSDDVQEILRGLSVGSLAYVYKDYDTDLAIEVKSKFWQKQDKYDWKY